MTVLILARGLEPARYGDFAFLIGSFVALKSFLEMGTSNAFYTFISQKPRGGMFLASYAGWQFLQFLTMILLIGIILPDEWLSKIWVGQDRSLVFLSFVAVFINFKNSSLLKFFLSKKISSSNIKDNPLCFESNIFL